MLRTSAGIADCGSFGSGVSNSGTRRGCWVPDSDGATDPFVSTLFQSQCPGTHRKQCPRARLHTEIAVPEASLALAGPVDDTASGDNRVPGLGGQRLRREIN